jgi:RND family efflux transporter MFP subunit
MKKILIFILICFFSVFYSCSEKKEAESKPETKRLRPVRAVTAVIPENGRIKVFSGTTASSLTSRLSFRVPGTIFKFYAVKGDEVQKGDLIACLDPKDYELKVEEVSASLARAKAQLHNADSAYQRVLSLYERGHASMSEVDQTKAAALSAGAVAESVAKQVELVKKNLEYTRLYAPMSCSVGSVHAEENENVAAGQPVAVLNCGSLMEVNIQVPSSFLRDVKKGKAVSVSIDSFRDRAFEGIIKEVGSSPDALNTSFPVTVELQKPSADIKPGMSALVEIESEDGPADTFPVLPPVCVGEDSKGNFVWKIESEDGRTGIIKKVYIETGEFSGSKIIASKGIAPGDLVVSGGVNQVNEGLEVRIEKEFN